MAPRVPMPPSILRIKQLLWIGVGLGAVSALCAVLFEDDLIVTWAQGNTEAKQIYDQGGLPGLEESSINVPAFAQLAVVMFIVLAVLVWMLGVFFLTGHGWARVGLTGFAAFGVFATAMTVPLGIPVLFLVLGVIGALVCLALLYYIWRPDARAYFRRVEAIEEADGQTSGLD